jgi:hypothetical protein
MSEHCTSCTHDDHLTTCQMEHPIKLNKKNIIDIDNKI